MKNFPLIIVLVIPFFCGCGEKLPDGMEKLYPTKLVITQKGKPLVGASVRLISSASDTSNQWTVGALTDEQGVATIRTHGSYDGAPAGKYKVCVTKTVDENPPLDPSSSEDGIRARAERAKKIFSIVPKEYKSELSTPFEVEIKGKTHQAFDIPEEVKEQAGLI